ncbi:ribosome-associated translation inhibitor RaiA [Candidatus Parcubacteria bacterium]|nr:ribosome-associated translation inhibitor RaiA [Candidatus Parcubacteria bacterium]
MNINTKATGIELTPAISAYIDKRLQGVEKYLNNKAAYMQVEVGRSTGHHKQGEVFRAEVRIAGDGADYYAVKEAEDLYAAIDMVKDEVVQEIKKAKGKKRELLRRGQRAIKDMVKGFPWLRRGKGE